MSENSSITDAVMELVGALSPPAGTTSYAATREVVVKHGDLLLTDAAERLLVRYFESKEEQLNKLGYDSDQVRWMVLYAIAEQIDLIQRCRIDGIEDAFASMEGMLAHDFGFKIGNFLSNNDRAAGGWRHVRQFLTPDLLSPRAFTLMARTEWARKLDLDGQLTVGQLYERIGRDGLDAALEDIEEFGTDVPKSLRPLLRTALRAFGSYQESGDRLSLSSALATWGEIIRSSDLNTASRYTQQQLLLEAANSFDVSFKERREVEHLSRAIEIWTEVDRRSAANHDRYRYLAYSYERRASNMLQPSKEERDLAGEKADQAFDDVTAAIAMYERAYELAESGTSGAPPAPMSGSSGGFDEWLWMRRQKAHHKNAIGRMWMSRYNIKGDREDLDVAVRYLESARELLEEDDKSPNILRDLANALLARFRVSGEFDDLQRCVTAFEGATKRFDTAQPAAALDCLVDFGLLLFECDEMSHARTYLEAAHNWLELTRTERASERSRLILGDTAARLYETLVSCCIRDGDIDAAFSYASAGKGRVLGDMLASASTSLTDLLGKEPALRADAQPYFETRNKLQELLNLLDERLNPPPHKTRTRGAELAEYSDLELLDDVRRLRRKEQELWEDVTSRYRPLAALGDLRPITAAEATALAAELSAKFVEYFRHRDEWSAFVIDSESVSYLSLPDLKPEILGRMSAWISGFPPDRPFDADERSLLERWHSIVWQPIIAALGAMPERLVLAPYADLHSIPLVVSLAYARPCDPGATNVCIAQSISILSYLRSVSAGSATYRDILAIAFGGAPGSLSFLAEATHEAEVVMQAFGLATDQIVSGEDATADNVVRRAPEADLIHFSCHATFDPQSIAQSGIELSGGRLTVRRILSELRLERMPMVAICACSSGRSDVRPGDDSFGLSQAFFAAGARAVISSMWKVEDQATRALFEWFYADLTRGESPAQSLSSAMLQMQREERWSHPYYWASFQVWGLGLD